MLKIQERSLEHFIPLSKNTSISAVKYFITKQWKNDSMLQECISWGKEPLQGQMLWVCSSTLSESMSQLRRNIN